MSVWEILTSESYDVWFQEQTEDDKILIRSKVYLLGEQGPNLGRPHADTLKGSKKLSNLKELRAKTDAHVFRIAYIFDPERKCLLLIGGDKKGKNQARFYKDLISRAEQIYTAYGENTVSNKQMYPILPRPQSPNLSAGKISKFQLSLIILKASD